MLPFQRISTLYKIFSSLTISYHNLAASRGLPFFFFEKVSLGRITAPDKEVFQIEAVDIDNEEWHELKQINEELTALRWKNRAQDELIVTLRRKLTTLLNEED